MELTGAEILLQCLLREGVTTLFGYPGGMVIDIYDKLSQIPELKHILVRHEQAAVHAADGYARATGEVGVCIVTSGPGATNAVTGIATANSDSIPMVIITGQVNTMLIGNDAFQEVDIVGITRPCTKHNYLVKDIKQLASVLRQAFHLARSGRPGPVLVDIPRDISTGKTNFIWPEVVKMRSYEPNCDPNIAQLKRAVALIEKAARPLIFTGGGVISSNSSELLAKLARQYSIPVVSTLMGLGSYPGDDPLWFGMVGMHGEYVANKSITESDLLIAVGMRFADRVTGKVSSFAKHAKIVHIDIDPTSIRKNVRVDIPIVADCKKALDGILGILGNKESSIDWNKKHNDWIEYLQKVSTKHPLTYIEGKEIKPQQAIQVVCSLANKDAIISTDVGQHQMWTAQFYTFSQPKTFLSSGGLGTMGFGLPAAMGAQVAYPDRQVILITGDGSIQMNIQEMATLVQNKIPVKIVLLNNSFLGMVRQWQELFFKHNYASTQMTGPPDFVKLAEAYGAEGYLIEEKDLLTSTLKTALSTPNPAIINIRVAKEENVYPMVPSGASLDEMLVL